MLSEPSFCARCNEKIITVSYSKKLDKNFCSKKCIKKELNKIWNIENNESQKLKKKKDYIEHKDLPEYKAYKQAYHEKNRDKHLKRFADYYANNTDKCIADSYDYKIKRMITDPEYKIRQNLSSRLYMAVKADAGEKAFSTIKLVGCSMKDLKIHLEKQFTEGMNWGNYGEWHIDHIIPCANFNLVNESEQLKCFNWRNLQPLWKEDNLSKGAKI